MEVQFSWDGILCGIFPEAEERKRSLFSLGKSHAGKTSAFKNYLSGAATYSWEKLASYQKKNKAHSLGLDTSLESEVYAILRHLCIQLTEKLLHVFIIICPSCSSVINNCSLFFLLGNLSKVLLAWVIWVAAYRSSVSCPLSLTSGFLEVKYLSGKRIHLVSSVYSHKCIYMISKAGLTQHFSFTFHTLHLCLSV